MRGLGLFLGFCRLGGLLSGVKPTPSGYVPALKFNDARNSMYIGIA